MIHNFYTIITNGVTDLAERIYQENLKNSLDHSVKVYVIQVYDGAGGSTIQVRLEKPNDTEFSYTIARRDFLGWDILAPITTRFESTDCTRSMIARRITVLTMEMAKLESAQKLIQNQDLDLDEMTNSKILRDAILLSS